MSRRRLLVGVGAAVFAPTARARAATPKLEVVPASALQDVPLRILVSGLPPSSTVRIAATMTARDGTVWRSHAAFRSDGAGNVAVATSAPIGGAYTVPSAMGLVWSMEQDRAATTSAPRRVRDSVPIVFDAAADGEIALQASAQRLLAAPGVRLGRWIRPAR